MIVVVGRAALLALVFNCAGCSFIFVSGKPANAEVLPPSEPVECTTSKAAPVLDTVFAGLEVARTGYAVSSSGGSGLVDLKAFGSAVDQAIIEDYAGSFDGPTGKCPDVVPDLQSCDSFGSELALMCATTSSTVSIGLITPGSNPFAPQALDAIASYGFTSVALWPDSLFLDSAGIPNSATWFSVLGNWLAE